MIVLKCIAIVSICLMFHSIWYKDDWTKDDGWRNNK